MNPSQQRTPSGKPRARAIGVPFSGVPGPHKAITDVAGVSDGHTTLIRGEGRLVVGEGPARVGRHLPVLESGADEHGSVIGIIATDIPLLPQKHKRLARRAGFGIGRSGSIAANGSGDLFLAFSTANAQAFGDGEIKSLKAVAEESLNPASEAVVETVEEAVINALIVNETMAGRVGHRVLALPHDELRELLKHHGRLKDDCDVG